MKVEKATAKKPAKENMKNMDMKKPKKDMVMLSADKSKSKKSK